MLEILGIVSTATGIPKQSFLHAQAQNNIKHLIYWSLNSNSVNTNDILMYFLNTELHKFANVFNSPINNFIFLIKYTLRDIMLILQCQAIESEIT